MNNKPHWTEYIKKTPVWISGIVGLISAVLSFVVLIKGNPYLSLVIIIGTILFFIIGVSLYITFARTPPLLIGGKGVFAYEKYRKFAVIIVFLVFVVSIVLLSVPRSQTFVSYAFLGTPTLSPTQDPSSLNIAKVILVQSDEKNRFEVTIYNPFERDILATLMTVTQSYRRNYSGFPCTPEPLFELSQDIVLLPSQDGHLMFEGQVKSTSGDFDGYLFPFKGEMLEFCEGGRATLSFDTSLIISKSSYTKFYIDIPKEFVFTNTYGLGTSKISESDGIYFAASKDEWGISSYEWTLTIDTDYNDSKPSYALSLVR